MGKSEKFVLALVLVFGLGHDVPTAKAQRSEALTPAQQTMLDDRERAVEAHSKYQNYVQTVSQYLTEVESRCTSAAACRPEAEKELARLERMLNGLKGKERAEVQARIGSLRSWLSLQASMDQQADQNVDVCRRWLSHERSKALLADYNASKDEQVVAEEAQKAQQAQQLASNLRRREQDRQYWRQQDEDANPYYPAYGYRRVRNILHTYRGPGNTGHIGGGSGPVSHSSARIRR
jgi:hypothetical protein